MKINISDSKHQLIISIIDQRFFQIENKIKEVPKELISFREFPYSVTDKKTEINYVVNKIEGGVSFSFQKAQLIDYDAFLLIDSLKSKIEKHLQMMVRMFLREGEHKEIVIQKMSYSPTDLEFSIQFGNMMNCQFYLSNIIGNCLMKKDEDVIHIYLIMSELLDGSSNSKFLKASPLNLNLLVQQKNIWTISEILYNTFLPSQIIQYMLVEYHKASNFLINHQFFDFLPTKELGIFSFRLVNNNSNLHLNISLSSQIINNKLQIHLREPIQYSMLMGHQKLDFNKFIDDMKLRRFQEFERINDFWEYIQSFFITTLAYTFFYDTKLLQLQIFQKLKHQYFFTKAIIPIISNIYQLKQNVLQYIKKDSHYQRQVNQIIQNLIDKYLHIYFIRLIDEVPILSLLLRIYLEKIDDQIGKFRNTNISFDHEINILVSKCQNILIELIPSETFAFSLKIQQQVGQLEYQFSKQFIMKKYLAQEKLWSIFEFPRSEEIIILNSF
ncbi:unnamed protein product [Paramecium sonneborni]|uniref:Uncharacterized protein n=1 Tax=Paramecium sonneborni TaxID=65129 RepID=A0A8S1RKK9_9CILI|nr:unnamed protein product [Paramecium sonneborni]